MKYSYNWLKELSGTKLSPVKLGNLLTMRAFEFEGLEDLGKEYEGVVVGEILEIQKHPNADKLRLAKINIGSERLDVVCGAPNIEVGQKVPVALVGAKLPNGMEIKEAEIRGVKSHGMLCAEDELKLGKDHSGILILEKNAKVGTSLAKLLKLDDTLIEWDVLANRSHDALSHVGMAREICALENKKLQYHWDKLKLKYPKSKKFSVVIKDKKLCSRYVGVLMENIETKESPQWVKSLLRNYGLNAVSNVVDATNYLMLELGQPMHAFDFDKVATPISVRPAKKGEKIKLLDEKVYDLDENDIVIADANGPIALAGIMGGLDSAIGPNTKNILLEAANFNPVSIRKTRIRLNLKTDASDRFEKEIDPNLAETAMARMVEILDEFGGKVTGMQDAYPQKVLSRKIELDLGYVNKLLGEKIPASQVAKILNSLELKTATKGKMALVNVPTFRIDLKNQEDLIEEIGRIYGYEKIQSQAPMALLQSARLNENRLFERGVKNVLASDGFLEVYNYSFYSAKDAELAQLGALKHLELQNPMNPDQAFLRVSLIPNILKNISENLKRFSAFRIFESGRVYWSNGVVLPEEKKMIVGAVVVEEDKKRKASEFYEAKGYAESLLEKMGINDYYFDTFDSAPTDTPLSLWHGGRSAQIKIEGSGEVLGYVGEINPLILVDFDIHDRVALFEFDLEGLMKVAEKEREYKSLRKYPTSERDISLLVQSGILVDNVLEVIQRYGGNLVLDVDLFDIFDFNDNETSLAFHIIFGAEERTLQSGEVDALMEKIVSGLEKELKVKIRK